MKLIHVLILTATCLAAPDSVDVAKPTSVDRNAVRSKVLDLSNALDDGSLAYSLVREDYEPRKTIWETYDVGASAIARIFNETLASVDARNLTVEITRAHVGRVIDVRYTTLLGMKPEMDMLSQWAVSHIWSAFRRTHGELADTANELYVLLGAK